jgi:transaldolase
MLKGFLSTKRVKIFADGADLRSILELAARPEISGFTTNPTLMRKAGIQDYRGFARELLGHVKNKPISFEVFADEFPEMARQAKEIASWAPNVYVKIPITNTAGQSSAPLVEELSHSGVKLNVTAVFSLGQVLRAAQALKGGAPSVLSVFAGRIADAGQNPISIMQAALAICCELEPNIELLWASPRELLNIVEADQCGCHIITVSHDILSKLSLLGKDLEEFSLDTVKMFRRDAEAAGYTL